MKNKEQTLIEAAEKNADDKFTKRSATYASESTITAIRENCISDYITGAKSKAAKEWHAPEWIKVTPDIHEADDQLCVFIRTNGRREIVDIFAHEWGLIPFRKTYTHYQRMELPPINTEEK